jgi:hypothetical protein
MKVEAEQFRDAESGTVAILGNGPSINDWDLSKLDCDTIGINRSTDYIQSKYYATVAKAFAKKVENGEISGHKAVFTCREISEECPEPIVQVNMGLPDSYLKYAGYGIREIVDARTEEVVECKLRLHPSGKIPIFSYDLAKPMHATFSGMLALQAALFLGYKKVFLIGMDGGIKRCDGDDADWFRHKVIMEEYHKLCFWHVKAWWENQNDVVIRQTNPQAIIDWFPVEAPPMKEE